MKNLSITIYEETIFWTSYFLDIICGFLFLLIFLFFLNSWRKMKKEKNNLYIAFFSLFLTIIISVFLIIPKSLDISYLKNNDSILMEGVFNNVSVNSTKKNKPAKTTSLTINNKNFLIKGDFKELNQYVGENVRIHYLPHSNYVLKLELIFKK